jgi:hypothetical protein
MTFVGLYMYDRAKEDVARGERKVERIEFKEKNLLPLITSDLKISAPPTPDPFFDKMPVSAVSATSATETAFDEPPRRRSLSISDQTRPQLPTSHSVWNLGSIMEMTTPPTSPQNMPFSQSVSTKFTRGQHQTNVPKGHRRRYSGSTHVLGPSPIDADGPHGGISPQGINYRSSIEEKSGWK